MRAVFFDLDGTLVELPDDFAALFGTALREHGVTADDERHEYYVEAFFDYLGDCHPEPYRMAMADLRERFDLAPSAESLAETYTEREAEITQLVPGVREVLDALDTPDTALGVLTNGASRAQRRKLGHHAIADRFEEVVISGDVGTGKPDPAIFAAAKDAIPADEYVFVADDLERDVLPAQEEGFTGVLLTNEEIGEENEAAESSARTDPTESNRTPDATDPKAAPGVMDPKAVPDVMDPKAVPDATVSSLREVPDALADVLG